MTSIRETFLPDEVYIHYVKTLVLNRKVGDWCQFPYHGHPKGCPNYNKRWSCPPKIGKISDHFSLNENLFLVNSVFNIESHAKTMKANHPTWSDRQARCVLYWQNSSRKQLRERSRSIMKFLNLNQYTECPEGMGVNVYATGRLSEPPLKLEKIHNLNICRHVALIGRSR